MAEMLLKCRCGEVEGKAKDLSRWTGNRLVCYCDDCQAFAHFLDADDVIDLHGGTDIYQMSPAQIQIDKGLDKLECVKLRPGGLTRWYAGCCMTPVANTVSGNVPFAGVVHNFMGDRAVRDATLGPVRSRVMGRFARSPPKNVKVSPGFPVGGALRFLFVFGMAKLRGKSRPNPFFRENGEPISAPRVLNED